MHEKHNTSQFFVQVTHDALCYWVNVTMDSDSAENGSILKDDTMEYLDLSITSNGLSIEEETIENLLGVLPYHFAPKFYSDGLITISPS